MKFYPFQILIIVLLSISFTACDWLDTNTDTTTSSNANFVSLRLTAVHTTDAAVANAAFTVEWDKDLNDSVIVNLDSLPYNTAIDTVLPTFSFYSTYQAFVYRTNDTGGIDSVLITGKDTLNFNKVVAIKNTASDQIAKKTLKIKVNVHKVDPEKYIWRKAVDQIYTNAAYIQKAIMLNDTIRFFTSTGLTTSLYTSVNGSDWSDRTPVPTLPDNALLENIVAFGNKAYLFHNDSLIYSTKDGKNWSRKPFADSPYNFKNLLYEFKGELWGLVQTKSDSEYHFAKSSDGINWLILSGQVDNNFPVGGYSAVSFASRTNQPKIVVTGGYNKNGVLQDKVWSSEDGTYWLDFSKENKTFGARTACSLINYEDKLLAFGGMNDDGGLHSLLFLQSADEGLSWKDVDSATMTIREEYTFVRNDSTLKGYSKYKRRFNQSVVVDKNKNIILIGGRDSIPQTFTDVWIGRLNKSVFIRK
jgi:hypothetical protein